MKINLNRIVGSVLTLLISTQLSAAEWQQYADPAGAGWSVEGLESARQEAAASGSTSVMIVEGGVVVAAWGPVDRPVPIYSMRKGIYNALVGMLVSDGAIDLRSTLAELDVDDLQGLTPKERSATVEHILASRSGIYHPSAYEPSSMKRNRPERGAHAPGEHWFYNNWDFNVVAHLIEAASNQSVGEMFERRIASPLEMEDFSGDDVFSFYEPSRSRYPAPIFRLSARDLARFGVMYSHGGIWSGKRLVDPDWIYTSWKVRTEFADRDSWEKASGFGYLWWIHHRDAATDRQFRAHEIALTRGSGGQVLAIFPELELVIVHLTDTDSGAAGSFEEAAGVIDAILDARPENREVTPDIATVSLRTEPLGKISAVRPRRAAVPWTPSLIKEITGPYTLNPQISFLVHGLEGRLFALPRGLPLAEVELFVDGDGVIFSPAVDLELRVIRTDQGEITALEGEMDGRRVRIEPATRRVTRKE